MEFVASKSATHYSKFSTASESVKGRMNRGYSLPSALAERAPRTAIRVAVRNTAQLAPHDAKFVLLNNPPFRA